MLRWQIAPDKRVPTNILGTFIFLFSGAEIRVTFWRPSHGSNPTLHISTRAVFANALRNGSFEKAAKRDLALHDSGVRTDAKVRSADITTYVRIEFGDDQEQAA